ncbi:MAG: fructosamine kinase family protein [Chloroflexota bacterium]
MDDNNWIEKTRTRLGAEVLNTDPLSGGCVGEVYRVRLSDGRIIVAKLSREADTTLSTEAYMLRFLAVHSKLPVPAVYYDDAQLLLMEYMPGASRFTPAAQRSAAEMLAALHNQTADAFGFEQDTLIGGLHQPNPWTDSWSCFFAEQRLVYVAQEAFNAGRLPESLLKRVESFAADVGRWIKDPAQPALIHGDVWTGNVLADGDTVTAFLDPAIYFGHEEIELAFIALFNTFGEPFFRHYDSLHPIAPGFFETRRDIYNLYPLLVHSRLFGGSYVSSVDRTLQQFGY